MKNMKSLIMWVFVIASALTITSCGDNQENGAQDNNFKPPFKATATDGFSTVEKKAVEKAARTAFANGKMVMVEVSAALCNPCLAADQYASEHPEEVAVLKEKVEIVKIEEMHLQTLVGMADFINTAIIAFPTTHLFDPKTGQWHFLFAIEPLNIVKEIEIIKKGEATPEFTQAAYIKMFDEDQSFAYTDDESDQGYQIFDRAIWSTVMNSDGPQTIDFFRRLYKDVDSKPELFGLEGASAIDISQFKSFMLDWSLITSISRGSLTFQSLVEAELESFVKISKEKDGSNWDLNSFEFDYPLAKIFRLEGAKAAAEKCWDMDETFSNKYPVAVGKEDQWNQRKLSRQIHCYQMAAQAKTKTPDEIKQFIDGEIAKKNIPPTFGNILATAGLFDEATVLLEDRIVNQKNGFTVEKNQLQDAIQKAEDAGQKDIAEATKSQLETTVMMENRIIGALEQLKAAWGESSWPKVKDHL